MQEMDHEYLDNYEACQQMVEFADENPGLQELNFGEPLCDNYFSNVIHCEVCGNLVEMQGSYEANRHQHEDWCEHGRESRKHVSEERRES